jgi:hypothetical protein
MHTGDPRAQPASPRWASRLRRHLGWVIAAKLLLILLLFVLFFSPSQRPGIDAPGVADRLRLDR